MTVLNTEAIINSTNEAMTDRTPTSERIFSRAGPQLRQEVRTQIKSKCLWFSFQKSNFLNVL